jgi:hypothetical protein
VGIASISQRGNVIFIVQTGGQTGGLGAGAPPVIGSPTDTAVVTQNIKLAAGMLTLLHSADIG